MTRINTVDVKILADAHLMAEYRELPMVHGALRRTLKSVKGFDSERVSLVYTLNAGHVYFFYNKGKFLFKRYNELINELLYRGFRVNPEDRDVDWTIFDSVPQVDWNPTKNDIELNFDRILTRIKQKPKFYKWTKREKVDDKKML